MFITRDTVYSVYTFITLNRVIGRVRQGMLDVCEFVSVTE